jgi:hypothetical protein
MGIERPASSGYLKKSIKIKGPPAAVISNILKNRWVS